jgi:hypothetical protein
MYCTKNYYWDSKTEQAELPPGEDCDYELGFGGLLLPVLRFLESSGGANKAPQDAAPLQAVLCMHVTSTSVGENSSVQ